MHAREHPAHFRLFRFPPAEPEGEEGASRPATATARVAARIREETDRIADLLKQAIADGVVRKVDPVSTARFLWAAWDGVIASHLGPANMRLTDKEFEELLNRARESLILGLLTPEAREKAQ